MDLNYEQTSDATRWDKPQIELVQVESVFPAVKGADWGFYFRVSVSWSDGTSKFQRDQQQEPLQLTGLRKELDEHLRSVRSVRR